MIPNQNEIIKKSNFYRKKRNDCKVECVLFMVVISMQPHAKIGQNDHRESAPHFSPKMIIDVFGALFLSPSYNAPNTSTLIWELPLLCVIMYPWARIVLVLSLSLAPSCPIRVWSSHPELFLVLMRDRPSTNDPEREPSHNDHRLARWGFNYNVQKFWWTILSIWIPLGPVYIIKYRSSFWKLQS